MRNDMTRRITLSAADRTARITSRQATLAETDTAIRLDECGYPPRLYLPRGALCGARLVVSETRTECPYKGEATYYHLCIGHLRLTDAVWSYHAPYTPLAPIAGRLAFDHTALQIQAPEPDG